MKKLIFSLVFLVGCSPVKYPTQSCWAGVQPTGPGTGLAMAMQCDSLSEADMMIYYVSQEACTKVGYAGSEGINYEVQEFDNGKINLIWSFRCTPVDLSPDLVPWPWQMSETY